MREENGGVNGRGWDGEGAVVKLAAVPGCELKCIFFFSSFSISSLRASRGRLDYQSRVASGTFFSVEHVGRKPGRKGSTSSSLLCWTALWCTYR